MTTHESVYYYYNHDEDYAFCQLEHVASSAHWRLVLRKSIATRGELEYERHL